jgi:hypothetical protein
MITLNDITELTLDGNGSFDKLMRAIRLHINDAIQNQEISQSEAGQIYVNVIPSIIQEAVRFEMEKDALNEQLNQEKLKTELAAKELELKEKQVDIAKKEEDLKEKQLKEVEKRIAGLSLQNELVIPNEERRKEMLTEKELELKEMQKEINAKTINGLNIKNEEQKIKNILLMNNEKRQEELFISQLEKAEAEAERVEAQVKQIEVQTRALAEQVVDNRWIKTIQNYGSFLGASLNGGMKVPPTMFQTYFGYMAKLNGIRVVEYGTLAEGDLSTDSNNPTEIRVARNEGIEYPYGGVSKYDPMKRNDFTSYTYKIELGYDADGKPITKEGVAFKAVWEDDGSDAGYEITMNVQHGDMIMQSGLPDKPRLIKIENHVKLAE